MPFAAETLFDVLSFLNRPELDALAAVNSYLNAFICKHFPTSPFNCIDELRIKTHKNYFYKEITGKRADSSLEELQKLANSRKWVVKNIQLLVQPPGFVAAEWKSKLELISSLWQGSTFELWVRYSPATFQEIFTWSRVFTCSHFQLNIYCNDEVIFPFHTFPLLYTFSTIKFYSYGGSRTMNTACFLTYLENIPKDRQHSLKVSWRMNDPTVNELLDLAQQSFAAAESPRPFYLQISIWKSYKFFAYRYFQVTNPVTRECLQFYLERPDEHEPVFVLKRSSL